MRLSHFKFNKQERSGIFFLLLFIVLLQVVYFLIKMDVFDSGTSNFAPNIEQQTKIDALKQEALQKDSIKIYPFNPNFITDYKGYTLGMSVAEIDKLHAFRKTDAYVNSAKEFQKVTKVSDSLLAKIENQKIIEKDEIETQMGEIRVSRDDLSSKLVGVKKKRTDLDNLKSNLTGSIHSQKTFIQNILEEVFRLIS